ncbi:DUF3592 domain-containing protein [Streptomyces sp. NPDC101169]|uniref:DUF3592 domain-containing protein n=1 Tax=Streptomyces sp. NPDC101169 TaxID=3366121 RepID=UPI0038260310
MAQREVGLSDGLVAGGSAGGWSALAGVVAIVVWMAFGPFGSLWVYGLGWAVALAAVDGVLKLLLRRGWAVPSPASLVAGVLRLGPESWLVAPRWARVRLAAGGFLVCVAVAGVAGWDAAQEYQVVADLRDQGQRTDATVVEVSGRSEEGWATSAIVRFATPSGSVRADVDVEAGSADAVTPGGQIAVVYDPARPAEVRSVAYLDGRDADGARQAAIVFGVLAAGCLVGATREVLLARERTE